MKNLILFVFIFSTQVFSQVTERSFEALVRNDNKKPLIEEVTLTDLISNDSFDGEYFNFSSKITKIHLKV